MIYTFGAIFFYQCKLLTTRLMLDTFSLLMYVEEVKKSLYLGGLGRRLRLAIT